MAPNASSRARTDDGFLPLDAYGLLGDGRTCALVGADGGIDWWSLPTMADDPTFGALLSPERGGRFVIQPEGAFEASQHYADGGAVLCTEFRTETGTVRVTDALNLGSGSLLPWSELARRVDVVDGQVAMRWEVAPGDRFGTTAAWARTFEGVPMIGAGGQNLSLVLQRMGEAEDTGGGFRGRFVARPGEPALLGVVATDAEPCPVPDADAVLRRLEETTAHWAGWGELVEYDGPWRDAVVRGAYVHKQLTSGRTGGLQAAATTSLPEKVGGSKNMDYRFCWVRDTGFAITALAGVDLLGEVHSTLSFLLQAVGRTAPDVRSFYRMDGGEASASMGKVPLWRGYRDSEPVHVGNKAAKQRQLGSYGDLMEAVSSYTSHGNVLDGGTARLATEMLDQVCRQWGEDDAGFWELGKQRPYASSKLGCWAALDRGLGLVEAGQLPDHHADRWRATAAEIRDYVDACCWSPERNAFTFYAGTDELDCATLLTARTGFCAPDDPRLGGTIDAVRAELSAGGPLLYRYSGMRGKEGAFLVCTFWLVEALSIVGRLDEARQVMDAAVRLGGDTGLLSEQADPETGGLLSNLPQVLSHLGLINAATTYHRASQRSPAPD